MLLLIRAVAAVALAVTIWAPTGLSLGYAQQRMLRVGIVGAPRSSPIYAFSTGAFLKGMTELGYEEGRDFILEQVFISRGPNADWNGAYPELATRSVDVFVANGLEVALRAAVAAANLKPVVMVALNFDPVARGNISSLARPDGNITGIISDEVQLTIKRFQLLIEIVPGLKAAAVYWDHLSVDQWQQAQIAAAKLGLRLHGVKLDGSPPYDFERAFEQVAPEYRRALIILGSSYFAYPDRKVLPEFALRHRIATVFVLRPYVDQGGLMSYGPNYQKMYARAAYFVDRIAKGAKPADLPVELPSQFELVVNLKTAKALGVTIPPSILVQAEEVIE
jgi:putative ABC transport system substrate-binding protein